jgi:hypothetical protein
MPAVLDPSRSKVDGLCFLGLSLSRKSAYGHADSQTHQTAFDLNAVLDRDYKFIMSTNDDGWLVGGGEPGPPESYKLAAKDSGHVELMRLGTDRPEWGGLAVRDIVDAIRSRSVLVPQIEVCPTAVVANTDYPPELEIRFDMEPSVPTSDDILNPSIPLPLNWQLRFMHNQLFHRFEFPSRFCPGAFHATIVRKAEFHSELYKAAYFALCNKVVAEWRKEGAKPLTPKTMYDDILQVRSLHRTKASDYYQSGIWLFSDRENITHHFEPNFLPPYNTPEKRAFIWEFLKDEWDEKTLAWHPVGTVRGWEGIDLQTSALKLITEPINSCGTSMQEILDELLDPKPEVDIAEDEKKTNDA